MHQYIELNNHNNIERVRWALFVVLSERAGRGRGLQEKEEFTEKRGLVC